MSSITPEQFPDVHHLIHLRDRLWARRPRGRAAVMVGAGFSLNAESRVAGNSSFPLWGDITARMLDELRPLLSAKVRKRQLVQYASGSGSLTLAREYELTFGRSALDELLLTMLPDSNYSPGKLHQALLALPWADVFTTNYDTLLERTPPGEEGRYYDVVVQPTDLPISTPPRIIKLHGSLPATKPFIITDEDFRRYPRDFAPFVNTVQQSMMENDFVLLGFSGDDPNFLSWLGWVRDELQVLRARVYLCGVLDISSARRLVLRERGVTVIDLGTLFPEGKLTRSERNQRALAWLLASLHNGQALEPPVDWPRQSPIQDKPVAPGELAPLTALNEVPRTLIKNFQYLPRTVSGQPAPEYTKKAYQEVAWVLDSWQREREEYPGWLALPHRNREVLLEHTHHMRRPLVQWITSLAPAERLRPLAELVWRLTKCVQLLFRIELEFIQQVLAEVPLPDDPTGQEQWATLAFTLLQDLRRSYDHQEFEALLTRLEPLSLRQPRYAAWRCWQAAMECLEHLNQDGARRWLHQWPDVPTDPVWNLRRAGLWAELNELETAERYALAALQAALQLQPRLIIRIDMLAVEAAARTLLRNIQAEQRWQATDRSRLHKVNSTKGELARYKLYAEYRCDALADINRAEAELGREEPTLQRSLYDSINPYTGIRVRYRTSRGGLDLAAYQPAFDILDSQEQRGLPFRFANTHYERLDAAGKWLLTLALPRTLGLIARSDNEALLQRIDKAAFATIEASQLLPLLEQAIIIGEEFFPRAGDRPRPDGRTSRYIIRHVALALRLLGRTAFRLDEKLRDRAVHLAWGVWENWFDNSISKRDQFEDFTTGLTNVLKPAEVQAQLPLLISAAPEPEYTRSALESIPKELLPTARPYTSEIAQAISTCLSWLTRPPGHDERRAGLRRLFFLHQLNWLTSEEQASLSTHLWAPVVATNKLPALGDDLDAWTVLWMPTYESVDAPALLKHYLLTQLQVLFGAGNTSVENQNDQPIHLAQVLVDILNATQPTPGSLVIRELAGNQRLLTWSSTEALQLLDCAEQLLQKQLPYAKEAVRARYGEPADWMSDYDECRYLGRLLANVVLPALDQDDEAAAKRVYACAHQLLLAELPARLVLPLLLTRLPQSQLTGEVTISIRMALLHPTDAEIVQDGAEALCRWAYGAQQELLPALPDGLLNEFVLRTGMPTLTGLPEVLAWATNLMAQAPQLFWPIYAPALGDSLASLLAETVSPTWRERNLARHVNEQERLFQRPQIREQAARLAGQLTWLQTQQPVIVAGFTEILMDWETAAAQDDLPEVRRAWLAGRADTLLQGNWHRTPES